MSTLPNTYEEDENIENYGDLIPPTSRTSPTGVGRLTFYKGSTPINSVYFGDTEIVSAYLGDVKVYELNSNT